MPFNPNVFFVVDHSLLAFTNGGVIPVSVYDLAVTNWNAVDTNNNPIPAQVVSARGAFGPAGGASHIEDRDVEWCGYSQDGLHYAVLPGAGGEDVMLTPTMDGCSFGVGHSAGDGTCIVTHANNAAAQVAVNTTGPMQTAQKQAIKAFYTQTPKPLKYVLKPDDYRWQMDNGNLRTVGQASTFGVRNAAHWRFWRHTYMPGMGDYTYFGLTRVK